MARPTAENEMKRKHRNQLGIHQMHYGPLGKPMTEKQKRRLTGEIECLEILGYVKPVFKHGEISGYKVGES